MKNDMPRALPLRLDSLVLVCKACGKRSSGPGKAQPKQLAQEFKSVGKEARRKTRVLMTGCMGLCPKRATAVVLLGAGGERQCFAMESPDQVATLMAAPPGPGSAPAD